MRIAKFLKHLSIDALFKYTFGDELDVFHVTDGPWAPVEWKYGIINPIRVTKDSLGALSGDYDVFIADDPQTLGWLERSGITARQTVFYNHGFYDPEKDPTTFNYLKQSLIGLPVIFATERHYQHMAPWVDVGPHVIAGRALMPQHSEFMSGERNGRIVMLGNSVLDRFKLYPGHEKCMEIWQMALKSFANYLDVYGYNDNIPVQFRRGFNPYVMELRYYNVGFYPSPCPVTNQSLMETLAMGVPVVLSFPRFELPEDGDGKFYFLEPRPNWVLGKVERLRCDEGLSVEMGIQARKFAKQAFDPKPWGEKVRAFLKGMVA